MERQKLRRLPPRAKWLFWLSNKSCLLLLIFGVLLMWWGFNKNPWIVFSGMVIFVFSFIWAQLIYERWKYRFTETGYKAERGVITKSQVYIYYGKMKKVKTEKSFLDKILGLSRVIIYPAGHKKIQAYRISEKETLPGLTDKKAQEIANELRKRLKEAKQQLKENRKIQEKKKK